MIQFNGTKKVAVLITCHNRVEKTLMCLENFFSSEKPQNFNFEIFLTDDGSTDGTKIKVKNRYSEINIINGDGNLFWNGGMRLAWSSAVEKCTYDFFMWLNDDTNIYKDSINEMFNCYYKHLIHNNNTPIVVGACSKNYKSEIFSYGLRENDKVLYPNGDLQSGNIMNGNFVLVPKKIFEKIGILSNSYTHSMGDIDYGLTSVNNGFVLITTRKFVASCKNDKKLPEWCDSSVSIKRRWRNLNSPKGLCIKEYKIFRKRFWPKSYFISIAKIYLRFLFPRIYSKLN